MAVYMAEPPDDRVRKVRIQVDDEWAERRFGQMVDPKEAREWLQHMLDVMLPAPHSIEDNRYA